MTWNYRICFRPTNRAAGFNIHEVYYGEQGEIKLYTARPIEPWGDSPDELYTTLKMMMDSFDKDVLDLDDLDYYFQINPEKNMKDE
jgi:hypothetical protein